MKRIALVFCLLASPAIAGDQPPTFDLTSHCESKVMAGKPEDNRPAAVMFCGVVEREARAKIVGKWGFVPLRVSGACANVSHSYVELNECLDSALQKIPPASYYFTLYGAGQERRYWTHGECMAARNGGNGVCANN